MQTFLPYPCFVATVRALDYRRLGKQRVEARQIITVLDRLKSGSRERIAWQNHPAVKMWAGYNDALKVYTNACIAEWVRRGYRNTLPLYEVTLSESDTPKFPSVCADPVTARNVLKLVRKHQRHVALPWWWNRVEFHVSHQSRLVAKLPEYYSERFEGIPDHLEYWWPSLQTDARGAKYSKSSVRNYVKLICRVPGG